jgi:REP element-mobilizing transposase RayT
MTKTQLAFELRTWGGSRRGAGRPRAAADERAAHGCRDPVRRGQPVHVTLRMAAHVWNLRSARSFAVFDAALRGVRERDDFRVVYFSVQGNHLHLLVEAEGSRALACGMRALSIRLARGLNRMMRRRGPVLADRYHAHVLATPAEVRNALRYVLGNHAGHAAAWGERIRDGWVDPFSSSAPRAARAAQLSLWTEPPTVAARGWLLRSGGVVPGHAPRQRGVRAAPAAANEQPPAPDGYAVSRGGSVRPPGAGCSGAVRGPRAVTSRGLDPRSRLPYPPNQDG